MPKTKRKARETTKSTDCQHHWIIEAPNGPTSAGECRACGEIRDFANYLESSVWTSGGVTLEQIAQSAQRGGPVTAKKARGLKTPPKRVAGRKAI